MDLMERERTDPNWRKRELDELTKPLLMEADLAEEMLKASFMMEFHEILDMHSAEYNEGFMNGWDRNTDFNAELSEIRKNLEVTGHNIYDAWVKEANAEVSRHIT